MSLDAPRCRRTSFLGYHLTQSLTTTAPRPLVLRWCVFTRHPNANSTPMPDHDLRHQTRQFATAGRIDAIGLRPSRGTAVLAVDSAEATEGRGLIGDRSVRGNPTSLVPSKRQVTLLQADTFR